MNIQYWHCEDSEEYWHCEEDKKKSILLPTVVLVSSVQSGGRGLVSTQCFHQFLHFEQTQKELTNSTQIVCFQGFQGRQNLHNQLVRWQSSSLSPSSSPCLSSGIAWQSLPKAIIPEHNRRFWLQNQWQGTWGSSQAQLGLFRQASTNTGLFLVRCCRFWSWLAHLRKTFYVTCDTDLVWE